MLLKILYLCVDTNGDISPRMLDVWTFQVCLNTTLSVVDFGRKTHSVEAHDKVNIKCTVHAAFIACLPPPFIYFFFPPSPLSLFVCGLTSPRLSSPLHRHSHHLGKMMRIYQAATAAPFRRCKMEQMLIAAAVTIIAARWSK